MTTPPLQRQGTALLGMALADVREDRVHGLLDDAIYLGQELARRLLARGAKRLVDAAREQ